MASAAAEAGAPDKDMLKVPQSTDEYDPVEASQGRRRLRRVAIGVVGAVAVLVLAAGGLYWRATTAAIRLGFFGARVEAALRQRLPPDARVAVGSTAVSYRSGQGVVLRIKNLELMLPGTARVAASELSTNTSVSALLSGRVDLQSVTVDGRRNRRLATAASHRQQRKRRGHDPAHR